MYRPVSPTRQYIFPFENKWNASKCDPTNLVPQGNDIDAAVTDLFAKHNRMHDWSYFLGFTEQNYNLQLSNFGNTGPTGQRVMAAAEKKRQQGAQSQPRSACGSTSARSART